MTQDLDALPGPAPAGHSGPALLRRLIWIYVVGSVAATAMTLFLMLLGLQFTLRQWGIVVLLTPFAVPIFVLADVIVIRRHFRPLGAALSLLDRGQSLPMDVLAPAIVRALNLPFYSMARVTLLHGPLAALTVVLGMISLNFSLDAGFQLWQVVGFGATALFFASPTHAIIEYFTISRDIAPVLERLWQFCPRLPDEYRHQLISVRLKGKLFYLSIFVTALPLLFFAVSVMFKVDRLLLELGAEASFEQLKPLWIWVVGVVIVCMLGALIMSILTASEVSRSAAKLIAAMNEVESGVLSRRLFVTGTDEYADLYRGYNLMTASLREEVRILEVTNDLAGELNLDVLLERIMRAAIELLGAERGTLFMHDARSHTLWSRYAEGLAHREIRIPDDSGIAGQVFQSATLMNVTDPYAHPLFNPEIDRRTGFETKCILCMPIVNKSGVCIGVTQVLNKRGGQFGSKDEARLRAFTAQIAVSLENARLFEDVLNMKNYNESILRSTSEGMITLNRQHEVVTVNDAAGKILRADGKALVGQPAAAFFGETNRWVMEAVERVEQTGDSDLSVDAGVTLGDGETLSVNMTAVPLIDGNQDAIGTMLILEDISAEKRVKSTMARYMSKEVVDQLLEAGEDQLGGKDQKISVLFSDVRSFTTISEALGARATVSMLNEYFATMVDVIFNNGGILDKYIGDAIMALFGAPFSGAHDADNAVTVANQMLLALQELNASRARSGRPALDIGVGLSTGNVIVGNIGSPKRMEYTVIGDSVNLASRLEGATKYYGTRILLSESTVQDLTRPFVLREIDFMRVKGKERPVAVYEALDYHSPQSFPRMDEVLDAFKAGLAAYRARDFVAAQRFFSAGAAANEDEKPSRLYLERCRHYLASPPPADWDGVWVLTEK